MTPEERAREVFGQHCEIPLPWMQGYTEVKESQVIAALLAFAAEERERCARVAEAVAEAQAEGWRRNPKSDECGGAIAANNTGVFTARAIRNLDQGQ